MLACHADDLRPGSIKRKRFAVRTIEGHGIKCVDDGEEPCRQRNLLPLEPCRITLTIETLLVTQNDVSGHRQERQVLQDMMTIARVFAHDQPFLIRQSSRLQKYCVRHTDLSDIVEQAAPIDLPEIACPFVVMRRQKQRVRRNPLGMKPGFLFSQVQRFSEGFNEHLIRIGFQAADTFARIQQAMLTGMTVKNVDVLTFVRSRAAFDTGYNGAGWFQRGRGRSIHGGIYRPYRILALIGLVPLQEVKFDMGPSCRSG